VLEASNTDGLKLRALGPSQLVCGAFSGTETAAAAVLRAPKPGAGGRLVAGLGPHAVRRGGRSGVVARMTERIQPTPCPLVIPAANPAKLREFHGPAGARAGSGLNLGRGAPQPPGLEVEGNPATASSANARLKAEAWRGLTGQWALADDSGLSVGCPRGARLASNSPLRAPADPDPERIARLTAGAAHGDSAAARHGEPPLSRAPGRWRAGDSPSLAATGCRHMRRWRNPAARGRLSDPPERGRSPQRARVRLFGATTHCIRLGYRSGHGYWGPALNLFGLSPDQGPQTRRSNGRPAWAPIARHSALLTALAPARNGRCGV